MITDNKGRGEQVTPWLFISDGRYRSEMNMARDEKLFDDVISGRIRGAVRFYNWDSPAITVGYHQKEKGFAAVPPEVPVFKRPTGGGAVLHYDDITFSICAEASGIFKGKILDTYKAVSEIFLEAFRSCGVDAEMKNSSDAFSDICFERTAQLELTLKGKKIMGAAQVRKKDYFLLQGVIPLNVSEELYSLVFGSAIKRPLGIMEIMPDFSSLQFILAIKDIISETFAANNEDMALILENS